MKNTHFIFIFLMVFATGSCGGGDQLSENTPDPSLRLSSTNLTITNSSGNITVHVVSNTNWTVESQASWLTLDINKGEGNMGVRISYSDNTTNERSGIVKFTADGLPPVELEIIQTELTFTNPIAGIPDPWIIKHGTSYYICKAQGNGINIAKSDKLTSFPLTSKVWNAPTDTNDNKVWNPTNIWAPELHFIDGQWYIYYAAGRPTGESNGSYTKQRSGVLRSKTDDPQGEWEDLGMLYTGDNYEPGIVATTENTNYAIDLGVFKLNNQLYAVWSGNPEDSGDQWLYIAKMDNPYTISSSRVAISKPDKPWELFSGKVNEGPAFLKNKEKGKFFVVYSTNGSWTKQYRLGYLELSDTLSNPLVASNWTKSANEVFFRNDETVNPTSGVNGVGHCSFTKSPDGTEDWIAYHVKAFNENGWSNRYTFLQRFTWDEQDGTPYFGRPVGWEEPIALPSGESR
ncbi:family 43 glycosylhydrolase [Flavivirga sp. 57AJ16]|uniref:family 43 glycosylhydrolase n=1 Tax=Flavivirga sp. 57AJ16 TaxID=3025307 RepID=UPI0023667B29|nr:family 43 glycosylhydrolase [Flavivirga sp. 57AJ16]MDD7887555.1 family 43 glycosylhydrolase [Flavivirga sp. 57AJ16]